MLRTINCFCICFCLVLCYGCGTSTSAKNTDKKSQEELDKKYALDKIVVPAGYTISVYAEVPNARSMAISPAGIVYVGNRAEKNVYAVVDSNKDGKADKVYTVAKDFDTPNGVAFKNGDLYFATISSIYKIENIEASLANPPAPKLLYDKFPGDAHHGWKFIAFGPDGRLYVPVGDPQNISLQTNPVYSTICSMKDDGSDVQVYARGIRNSVGFDWHPANKLMWFTDNGRDELGDDVPADELNFAPQSGMHFGHPYCLQGNITDPKFGVGKSCADYKAPATLLGSHVAALGMRFYTGSMFDSAYKTKAFIAEHGSWNRSKAVGYRVMTVDVNAAGTADNYKVFAEGWLQADGKVLGRPVDVLIMPDGALLISDDYAGAIYRVAKKV